jgi:hypothetical protein
MYPNYITKAQELLDATRKAALRIKEDAPLAWWRIVTEDLIKIEVWVSDYEVTYVLSDLHSGITTNSYSEAVNALGNAIAS